MAISQNTAEAHWYNYNPNPDVVFKIREIGREYSFEIKNPNVHKSNNSGPLRCYLAGDKDKFNDKIKGVYRQLKGILDNDPSYDHNIDIDKDRCELDLKTIIDFNLFNTLFGDYHQKGQPVETRNCANEVRTILSSTTPLKIRIESDKGFFFPWGLLYYEEYDRLKGIKRESFCGFRHAIEQRPITGDDHHVNYSPIETSNIPLSFAINSAEIRPDYIDAHRDLFKNLRLSNCVRERPTKDDILEDFSQDKLQDIIIYFLCHAEFMPDDIDRSNIRLSPSDGFLARFGRPFGLKETITLGELKAEIRLSKPDTFSNGPLVFLNACESALMSPLFYDGFLPYFIAKGARGMIGTLCQIPTIFASSFGTEFLQFFFMGKRADEILPNLRRYFLLERNNLLGLFYTSCCDPGLSLRHNNLVQKIV